MGVVPSFAASEVSGSLVLSHRRQLAKAESNDCLTSSSLSLACLQVCRSALRVERTYRIAQRRSLVANETRRQSCCGRWVLALELVALRSLESHTLMQALTERPELTQKVAVALLRHAAGLNDPLRSVRLGHEVWQRVVCTPSVPRCWKPYP